MGVAIGQTYEIINVNSVGKYQTIFGPGNSPDMWCMIIDCVLNRSEVNVDYFVQNGLWVLQRDQSIKHAWFSAKHESMSGSWALVSVSGRAVRVTSIGDKPSAPGYNWSDRVYMGEIYDGTHHDERKGSSIGNGLGNNHIVPGVNPFTIAGLKSCDWTVSLSNPKKKTLAIGDICSVCGKEWKERALLTSTYMGCWCA
jgi:hypothetical protein